ncbi:MAG TPA: hypothetical protein VGB55_04460 [Tepidisphaeraceae bacterium]|jgi:hypothetical protein
MNVLDYAHPATHAIGRRGVNCWWFVLFALPFAMIVVVASETAVGRGNQSVALLVSYLAIVVRAIFGLCTRDHGNTWIFYLALLILSNWIIEFYFYLVW